MMDIDPEKRPSAFELLEDPFLLDHAQVKITLIHISVVLWGKNSVHAMHHFNKVNIFFGKACRNSVLLV